jgi:hypothetical protein
MSLSLAVAADALLREGLSGIAFPVLVAMLVTGLVVLAWRAGAAVSREAVGWLAAALLFSVGLAWRDAGQLQAFDLLATVIALVAAAASLNSSRAVLFAPRLRYTASAALRAARSIAGDFVPLVVRDAAARVDATRWTSVGRRTLCIVLLAGALTVVFGSLLVNADPIFASFVRIPNVDLAAVVRHAIIIAGLTWVFGGGARGALIEKPRAIARLGAPAWQLGTLEVTTIFVTLVVLFSAFMLAQLGWLFGGEAFLKQRTGLTAASYARQGFFQMVWIVTLVIPLIVGSRALVRSSWALARQHTRFALPVVALLGAILVSAALRMQLYVRYYGLSTDRFYPLVFMAWLAFVLVWLTATTLRGRARRFGPGVMLSALTVLAGVNIVSPDRVVARVNVARSQTLGSQPLDAAYLSTLSGEAVDWMVPAVLADARLPVTDANAAERCRMLKRILWRWNPSQRGDWRSWNAGRAHAVAVVREHTAELEVIHRDACSRADAVTKAAQSQR